MRSVSLEFAAGEDIDLALSDVRKAVDDAKPDLPADADEPKVIEVSLSLFPVLTAALYGTVSEREMVQAARDIKDKLEALPGILEVEIGGDREEVLRNSGRCSGDGSLWPRSKCGYWSGQRQQPARHRRCDR